LPPKSGSFGASILFSRILAPFLPLRPGDFMGKWVRNHALLTGGSKRDNQKCIHIPT
jgi:hypothetical protein